ncbi:MAG: MmcQ/YjbR family DNA-binding protein [Clostridiales bacterium]|nr:MmcQ/YjbR family DNA-binding protein [Clostridiales bacterium]
MYREKVFEYIKSQYGEEPDYPWERDNDSAVFRHRENRKWFALVMTVRKSRFGLDSDEPVHAMNLKIDDPLLHDMLIHEEGIYPSYHMNKTHWISVLLDGTVPEDNIFNLIDISFRATAPHRRKKADRPPKEWLIPANPKYYDAVHIFDDTDETDWKQGAGVRTGDTIYLYVAAPVSAILFKCRVTKTDIPYEYKSKDLSIKALMKIKLLKRYDPSDFTFEVLRDEYGVNAIRGPRGIPNSLSSDL